MGANRCWCSNLRRCRSSQTCWLRRPRSSCQLPIAVAGGHAAEPGTTIAQPHLMLYQGAAHLGALQSPKEPR